MGIGDIFNTLFIFPITNLLVFFYKMLLLVHIPYALGFAIILLTIFIRIILYPFMSAQLKAADKMRKVAPHMSRIKEQFKGDRVRQQQEMMKLYKEHGVNPAGGCLPSLVQLPIIWSLYTVLISAVGAVSIDGINKINTALYFPFLRLENKWDTTFFGISLSDNPSKLISMMPLIILLPVLTGFFQYILSKMMMPEENTNAVVKIEKKKSEPDFQTAFQKQSLYIFPAMIGFFSYTLPVGLSLYWNTFTIFGILQQYMLVGWGGMRPWIDKIKK